MWKIIALFNFARDEVPKFENNIFIKLVEQVFAANRHDIFDNNIKRNLRFTCKALNLLMIEAMPNSPSPLTSSQTPKIIHFYWHARVFHSSLTLKYGI